MRGPPSRVSITASKANSRLGLAALVLALGASIALGAGAVRVLTLPLAPEAQPTPEVASAPAAAADGAAAVAGLSKEQHSEQRDQNLGTHSQGLSPAKAVALVQRRYHAQVVRTKMQTDASGRQLYVFRLLSAAGRVWTVRIDAHTGAEVP